MQKWSVRFRTCISKVAIRTSISYLQLAVLKLTFSVLQYLVGSAQLCLLRRCHSVYVSCQCFTDSVVSTLLSNFVPICWHLDIHVRVERIFLFAAYYWYRALKSKMLAFNFVTKKRSLSTSSRKHCHSNFVTIFCNCSRVHFSSYHVHVLILRNRSGLSWLSCFSSS